MTSVSKNVFIDKLDDIVNEYSNTYHKKMNKDFWYNERDPKFEVDDHLRISEFKSTFAKGCTPN